MEITTQAFLEDAAAPFRSECEDRSLTQAFLKNAAALFRSEREKRSWATSILLSELSKTINTSEDSTMCQHCKCFLMNSCSLKIVPKKIVGKQMKKLVWKAEKSIFQPNGNKCRASLLKKYSRNNGNKLVITCLVCNKKNIKLMNKPVREEKPEVIANDPNIKLNEGRMMKRKKKRDKLAGLNALAVEKANLTFGKVERAMESSEMMPKKTKKLSKNAAIAATDLVPNVSKFGLCLSKSIGISNTDTVVPTNNPKHKNIENMNKVTKLIEKQKKIGVKVTKNALVASAVVGKISRNSSKLKSMLAMADAAKLTMKKKEKKTNFLDSLQLLLEK